MQPVACRDATGFQIALGIIGVDAFVKTLRDPVENFLRFVGRSHRNEIVPTDVAAVYRSLEHHHPVVNGYSGYAPPHYEILRIGLRLGDTSLLDEI